MKKTGLALSGGGVRASVFHLGMLARLAETELWDSIDHISTVSGGSLCVALIFEKAGKRWPNKDVYLDQCLPAIHSVLTSFDLEKAYKRRIWLHLLEGRARIIGKLIEKHWGITSCISEIPYTNPRWTINATCYETGKNWRFHKKRMGDYIANYVVEPKFPLSDAVAASAAVPGAIGPLKLTTKHYAWNRFSGWSSGEPVGPIVPVEPVAKALTLWDGGVYDNLGAEAIYKIRDGLRYDLNFAFISDASKPLRFLDKKWFKNIALPRMTARMVNIPMDQVRSVRARELFGFFRDHDAGGYLRLGELVEQTCRNLKVKVPDAHYMTPTEIKSVSEFDTTLRKLSGEEFQMIFRHGYEVCSIVLYGIKQSASFLEYDQSKYSWMTG